MRAMVYGTFPPTFPPDEAYLLGFNDRDREIAEREEREDEERPTRHALALDELLDRVEGIAPWPDVRTDAEQAEHDPELDPDPEESSEEPVELDEDDDQLPPLLYDQEVDG